MKKHAPMLISLIFAVASAVLIYLSVQATRPTVPVVVAAQNISVGQEITKENVQVKKMPAEAVPRTAFRAVDAVVGKTVTAGPVLAGDIVRAEHVSTDGALVAALRTFAPQGWVAVELPPDTAVGMAGIRRGDVVDVYAEVPAAQGTFTGVVARDAVVLSTPWTSASKDEKGKYYVLAVRPEEAQAIAALSVRGKRAAIVLKGGRQ
ncbi:Flp pilus assembly protein CpaB [Desulfovirgula thermocuniculi]|uniref:Flp pilus assembly protein CpaB n=1 Tax=Desulfovirgula thermocuniculi TaxID=348842 RepID=UPI00041FE375|nr:Flp pilus assembly protein CpaB [Desulfovirgula thermocuniculi]